MCERSQPHYLNKGYTALFISGMLLYLHSLMTTKQQAGFSLFLSFFWQLHVHIYRKSLYIITISLKNNRITFYREKISLHL